MSKRDVKIPIFEVSYIVGQNLFQSFEKEGVVILIASNHYDAELKATSIIKAQNKGKNLKIERVRETVTVFNGKV